MSFPTVKSCPYKRKRRAGWRRFRLWSEQDWKRIVDSVTDASGGKCWIDIVRELNQLYYGGEGVQRKPSKPLKVSAGSHNLT